jgi:hypothetical protein
MAINPSYSILPEKQGQAMGESGLQKKKKKLAGGGEMLGYPSEIYMRQAMSIALQR